MTVYRLISRGTIEEAILRLHLDKRDLIERVIDGGSASSALSTDEMIALLKETAGVEAEEELRDDRRGVDLEIELRRVELPKEPTPCSWNPPRHQRRIRQSRFEGHKPRLPYPVESW